jgi:hypothetical protein
MGIEGDVKPIFSAVRAWRMWRHGRLRRWLTAHWLIGSLSTTVECALTRTSQDGVPSPFTRCILANIFDLDFATTPWPQVTSERSIEKFLEHLKADARQSSVIPALA